MRLCKKPKANSPSGHSGENCNKIAKMRGRTNDQIVSCLPGLRKRTTVQVKTASNPSEIVPIPRLPTLPILADLQSLPAELLAEVDKSLPISSRLSLAYTCGRFRSYFLDCGLSNKALSKAEQWRFLCMLERDRPQHYFRDPASRALCSTCRMRHAVMFFSPN